MAQVWLPLGMVEAREVAVFAAMGAVVAAGLVVEVGKGVLQIQEYWA